MEAVGSTKTEDIQCASCGSSRVTITIEACKFPLTAPNGVEVWLDVTQPVMRCPDCNMEYTDYLGEQARSEAVYKYLYSKLRTMYEMWEESMEANHRLQIELDKANHMIKVWSVRDHHKDGYCATWARDEY